MNIVLPEKFHYEGTQRKGYAEVKDNQLIIYGTVPFKDLMYSLTYAIYGKDKCYFCGKPLENEGATLDHLYPQDLGGPTIPNNMVPACSHCNNDKSNLTCEQYQKLISLTDKREIKKFKREISDERELLRKNRQYDIPEEWLTDIKLSTVIVELFFEEKPRGTKYRNTAEFYKKYGYFQRPLIVNKSHYLFSGFTELIVARLLSMQKIPAIVLDNVKVVL